MAHRSARIVGILLGFLAPSSMACDESSGPLAHTGTGDPGTVSSDAGRAAMPDGAMTPGPFDASGTYPPIPDGGYPPPKPLLEWCLEPNPSTFVDCGTVVYGVSSADEVLAARQCVLDAIALQLAYRMAHLGLPRRDEWFNTVYTSDGNGAPTSKVGVTGIDAICGSATVVDCGSLRPIAPCVVSDQDLCLACENMVYQGTCWADCVS